MIRNVLKRAVGPLLSAALASAMLLPMLSPSYALYNDQTRNYYPRDLNKQVVQTYRLTINWNDPNIGASQIFGALPANAYILSIDADVTTAFNAGTTNVLTLGVTKGTHNEIVASGITAGTIGVYHLTSAAGLGVAVTGNTADQVGGGSVPAYVPLYANYTQTGTAGTAGSVTIVISYVSNNDM